MTQDEKQIAIAEACGWTEIEPCTCHNGQSRGFQPIKGAHKKHTPDYFHDLDAIHEAEKMLPDNLFVKYIGIIPPCAGPIQRAETFGVTLGLWTR